jgi:hypothetical protein
MGWGATLAAGDAVKLASIARGVLVTGRRELGW